MRINFDWLCDYVAPELSARECAARLTMLGFPLDASEEYEGDTVMNFDVTTNRPDAMNHLGLARELAAKLDKPLCFETPFFSADKKVSVDIQEPELCPRYSARLIRGIKNGPAPASMRRRLESIGARSINGVVDVTNYVLFEMGQPLHAFDASRLREGRIVVRRAKKGETLKTLDGELRTLNEAMLVIADAKIPVALAGVMGGFESEVGMNTRDLLLESAYFTPLSIRKTAKALGLHSEASHRFERGADYEITIRAMDRACGLIVENFGGEVTAETDCQALPPAPREVTLRWERLRSFLGQAPELEKTWTLTMLQRLGFRVLEEKRETCRLSVPSFRSDVEREVDIIEEIARHFGYDRITAEFPPSPVPSRGTPPMEHLRGELRKAMVGRGFCEIVNYSMVDPVKEKCLGANLKHAVRLKNPLSEDASCLRQSLWQGLLRSLSRNLNFGRRDLRLFEIGTTFHRDKGKAPKEKCFLCAAALGHRNPPHWSGETPSFDVYDMRGVAEHVLSDLGFSGLHCEDSDATEQDAPVFASKIRTNLFAGKNIVGSVGAFRRDALAAFNIDIKDVLALRLDIDALFRKLPSSFCFTPVPKYLPLVRQLSFLLPSDLEYASLDAIIKASHWPYVQGWRAVDFFEGPPLPEGKKSLSLEITFQPEKGNLTENEVAEVEKAMVKVLTKRLGVKLRGSFS